MPLHTYQAAWIIRIVRDKRTDIGMLVWKGSDVRYFPVKLEYTSLGPSLMVKDVLASMSPKDAVKYLLGAANGINWDISVPKSYKGKNPETIVQRLLKE